MTTHSDIDRLDGTDVYDTDGEKIGSVGQVFLNANSGEPEWVTVKTGLFGTKETFVPLGDAHVTDDRITVAYTKDHVKDAPRIDADGPLSYAEEQELYTFYALESTANPGGTYQDDSSDQDGSTYRTSSAGYHDDGAESVDRSTADTAGGDAMTRSEERLVADTRTEETGKARLRKYVVTEQQQVTVPVSHEEVRIQREPITDANAGDAYDGPQISEAEHEVTLHAERPVVDTETVPVERVRLQKETVRDEESVSGEVRKEQIEFDGPDANDRR